VGFDPIEPLWRKSTKLGQEMAFQKLKTLFPPSSMKKGRWRDWAPNQQLLDLWALGFYGTSGGKFMPFFCPKGKFFGFGKLGAHFSPSFRELETLAKLNEKFRMGPLFP